MDKPYPDGGSDVPSPEAAAGPGCGFWLFWLFATVVGGGLGWLAGWWVSFQVPGDLGTLALGLVAGAVLGLTQGIALRGYIPSAGRWILASALGWGIGFFGGAYLGNLAGLVELPFGLAIGAAVGLCSGVAQWLVLRRVSSHASWWVLASLFSWTSAFIYYSAGISLRGAFFGLLVGILTGWALIGIFNFPGDRKKISTPGGSKEEAQLNAE